MASRKSGPETAREALDRLLRESEALRRRSEALAAEVETLRDLVAKDGHPPQRNPPERRKKPRLRGK